MNRWMRKARPSLLVAACLCLAAPAAWAVSPKEFQLSKAIPTDVYVAVCARSHPGQEFLNTQVARVWAEVEAVRLDRDFKRLFKSMAQQSGGTAEEFDAQWQQMTDLCTSVNWSALAGREFAFCLRLGFPTVEFAMLMLPEEGKSKECFDGLGNVAKSLIGLAPGAFDLQTTDEGDTTVHKIGVVGAQFPISFTLARHGETIVIGFGSTLMEQVWLQLGSDGSGGLVASERFTKAIASVAEPEDEFAFFDIARMMTQIRGMLDQVIQMASASMPAEGTPQYEELMVLKTLPGRMIDAVDIFEYMVSTSVTKDKQTTGEMALLLKDDAKDKPLYPVLMGNKGFAEPLKYIPNDVGNFWVTSGVNLAALYQEVVKFIRTNVPDGEEIVAGLAQFKEETGFDLEQDIVGWMEGRMISFSVPGPTPYSPGEFVMMISVSSEDRARGLLDRVVEKVQPMLAGDGQSQPMASIRDAEIEDAPGFRSVIVPTFAMFGLNAPTIGVKDGWLMIGSSPEILTRAFAVAAGTEENFGANERFQKEGIVPKGEVIGLGFEDLTKLGEELGQVLQMVPMIGMMAPDVMKEPVARAAIDIIGKFGRVVRKLDFFQSSASVSTLDGNLLRTRMLTTYREPPAPPKKPTSNESEAPAGESESSGG